MSKIPPRAVLRETFYPKQMFMDRRNGNIVRKAFATRYDTPVQGPDLPYVLEMRRQQVRAAQEEYERELAAERERQAYNRRAQAFNEYQDLPIRERQLLANRDRIARRLWKGGYTQSEMDAFRLSRQELPELDRWAKEKPQYPGDEFLFGTIDDYPIYEDFDEFPEELVNMPWRR